MLKFFKISFQCFEKHNKPVNGKAKDYPLCGIELKDFMFAAKDTPTCRRKTEQPNAIPCKYHIALTYNSQYQLNLFIF